MGKAFCLFSRTLLKLQRGVNSHRETGVKTGVTPMDSQIYLPASSLISPVTPSAALSSYCHQQGMIRRPMSFGGQGRIFTFTFDIHADSELDTHVILSKQSRQSVAIRFSVG